MGGLGDDTAVFSGKSVDYLITDIGGGKITVKDLNTGDGNDGTDTLSGIDALQFSDQVIDETNSAPVNSVPAAQATNEDTKLTFNSANKNLISISDSDADGADVQVILDVDHGLLTLATTAGLTSVVGNGTATVTLVGTVTEINAALNGLGFAPTLNFNGGDTLTITTNDLGNIGIGGALEDKDTVAITINPVNDNPNAVNDTGTTGENTTLTVSAANGVLKNDTDVDGDTLTVSAVTGGTMGVAVRADLGSAATLNADGSYVYNPTASSRRWGSARTAPTASATRSPTARAAPTRRPSTSPSPACNDAPVAVDDTATTGENTTLTVNAANGVLKNDTDVDGDTLTVSAVTGGTVGVQFGLASGALLTLNADGSYVYNPNGKFEALGVGENGADSFSYTVSDGKGGTDTATVNLTITGVNDAPVAADDAGTTGENTTVTANAAMARSRTTPTSTATR